MNIVIYMNINRLRQIREDHDFKQIYVAKILKVTQAQYSRYEQGLNVIPIEKLNVLANLYNTSIDYLVYRTDERKPYPKPKIEFIDEYIKM